MARRKSSDSFKDDGPTMADGVPSGVPQAPLDLDTEPVALRSGEPTARLRPQPVALAGRRVAQSASPPQTEHDAIWDHYEAGLRVLGKMSALRTPRELEDAVARPVARLGGFLRASGRSTADELQRAQTDALKIKLAVARFESWFARK